MNRCDNCRSPYRCGTLARPCVFTERRRRVKKAEADHAKSGRALQKAKARVDKALDALHDAMFDRDEALTRYKETAKTLHRVCPGR